MCSGLFYSVISSKFHLQPLFLGPPPPPRHYKLAPAVLIRSCLLYSNAPYPLSASQRHTGKSVFVFGHIMLRDHGMSVLRRGGGGGNFKCRVNFVSCYTPHKNLKKIAPNLWPSPKFLYLCKKDKSIMLEMFRVMFLLKHLTGNKIKQQNKKHV